MKSLLNDRILIVQEIKSTSKGGIKLEIGIQIKKYRNNMKISQEELAEKVYVSRQTISNRETGKNYPDIHSILLLSSIFNISLDQLVKGDIEIMKKEINVTEIKKFNRCAAIYGILLVLTIISLVPLIKMMSWYGMIPWAILYGITVYYAFKADKIKKDNDISTYKEIVAFTEGRQLDEIEQQREIGKRPYQTVIYMIGSGVIAFVVVYLMAQLFSL